MKDERIHMRIPAGLKQEFIDKCERETINPSALVRKWIEEYVKEEEIELTDWIESSPGENSLEARKKFYKEEA